MGKRTDPAAGQLLCPGSAAPVSRGTHLARLAGGWAACGGCPHRHDHRGAPPALVRTLARRTPPPDPFGGGGPHGVIGGVAGAAFDAATAARLAVAFASTLPAEGTPAVVLARDHRPAHRALLPAVAAALRVGGCDVLHLGETTLPAVSFAVREHAAAGGLWLAAPGRPATHGGVVPLAAGGGPLTDAARAALRTAFLDGATRRSRTSGTDRGITHDAYDRSLWPAFRTLSARTVAVACGSPAVRDRLTRLFATLPDELHVTASAATLPNMVRETNADFGLRIEEAGVGCELSGADGESTPWVETAARLAAGTLAGRDRGEEPPVVALTAAAPHGLRLKVAAAGGRVREVAGDPASLWAAVEGGAALALGDEGVVVFATPHGPSADAVRVLAGLLTREGKAS